MDDNLTREEILEKIEDLKESVRSKGYGINYSRMKRMAAYEMYLKLPITYKELIKENNIIVDPIGENKKVDEIEEIFIRLNEKATKPAEANSLVSNKL